MSCGEFLSVCVLAADVADVDEIEMGMYIRGDCSPRGVMLQLRPQRQYHLKSPATSSSSSSSGSQCFHFGLSFDSAVF